jgi:hypothetical protein
MFEADAGRFRDAGIRVGADQTIYEVQLFQEVLSSFPLAVRNESLRMARIYSLMYAFENSVRVLIRERLEQIFKADWWSKGVPQKIQRFCENRKEESDKNSWLQGQKAELLSFADFGQLADIIVANWDNFTDLFVTQHWVKQRMDELEKARNFIAHNRILADAEFRRIEMYISDWNAQVGV